MAASAKYRGRLRYSGSPQPGDIVIYRTTTREGEPACFFAVCTDNRRTHGALRPDEILHAIPDGAHSYQSLTGTRRGPLSDDAKGAPGTWRWPKAGEVWRDEASGKWAFSLRGQENAPPAPAKPEATK